MRRRALVATYSLPEPDRDSGGKRLFEFLLFLREAGWGVDLVLANGLGDGRGVRDLHRLGIAVHDDAAMAASDGQQARSGRVKRLCESASFDLALLAFWPVAEYYLPMLRAVSPPTRVLVDSVDLHFLRNSRYRMQPEPEAAAPRLFDGKFGEQMIGELNVYLAADGVLTVSPEEAAILADGFRIATPLAVVPDCEDLAVSPRPLGQRRGILMLGSYAHAPNVQALEFLVNDVLPRVDPPLLAEHPLYVVGHGVTPDIQSLLENQKSIRLVGWVPSVEPYFHQCRISAIPLRYGAGTKRKMVQSLLSGTPAASTGIGAEGLALVPGEHALIADDAAGFAANIERLLTDDALWQAIAANGRAHIVTEHSRAAVRQRFFAAIESVLAAAAKPPMLADEGLPRYWDRINDGYYQQIGLALRKLVEKATPAGAIIAVAAEGNAAMLSFGSRTAWQFPQDEAGRYQPETNFVADHLVALAGNAARDGADFLLLPRKKIDQYRNLMADFDDAMAAAFPLVLDDAAGRIYSLKSSMTPTIVQAFDALPVKLIAFYLPQFHPIPENDEWWGEGFTEWRNVAKAQPLFPGHEQPRLPADLGFCDLRLAETRAAQASLAREYGLHGFCYYHYWFHGKRLLEHPFNEVLTSGQPDFPFCLCWANEPWSRRWDGSETDVLQPQSYSPEDDLAHIRWLAPALADRRAIRVEGKPLFLVYRADQLPNAAATVEIWRREAERAGLPGLYLVAVESGWDAGWDATQVGFDAKVLFQPQFSLLAKVPALDVPNPRLRVFDYNAAWPLLARPEPVSYPRFDCVFPSWDNTPRKGETGWVVHGSTPAAYEAWLKQTLDRAMAQPPERRIVFLNAWNEWAEGAHLEPDRQHGRGYLEATRRALLAVRGRP